ncbi:MAG: hypothetical protein ACPGOT_00930 [Candidatus Poseidoniaceae archaeon]
MSDVPRPLALLALVCAMLLGPAVVLFLSEGSALDREAMWIGLANDVFVGFTITSVGMILLLVAYGDNRDRPAAPVFGLSLLAVVGFMLGLWLLQAGDFVGDASSPLARFFTELVHLAPVGLGLALAAPVSLLVAALGLRTFALDEAEDPQS